MLLSDWLDTKGLSARAFGLQVGLSTSTITRTLNGETEPNRETMMLIIKGTGGKVTARDLLADRLSLDSSNKRNGGR